MNPLNTAANAMFFSKYNIYKALQLIYKFFFTSEAALMILFFGDNNRLLCDVSQH